MCYRSQGHGFYRCKLDNLASARARHVEAQRKVVCEIAKQPAVADAVAAVYGTDASGVIREHAGIARETDWKRTEWLPVAATATVRRMGSTAPQPNGRGGQTWAEPKPYTRAKLEKAWKAGKEYDWDGLLREPDVRAETHVRFGHYARIGGHESGWAVRWAEMAVV